MAIIHEYSISLGPGNAGPRLCFSYWSYEKETKQEINQFLRAKMGEPYPTVLIIDTKDEKTTFVLERNRRGNPQLMQLLGLILLF